MADIREMTIEDIAAVADLEERLCSELPYSQTALFSYHLRDDAILTVAVDGNDEPYAFMGLLTAAPDSDVLDITVDTGMRNQGVGRALFEDMFERAGKMGVHTYYLEVRVGNAPARHLYEKLGFKEIGYRKNYYQDPVEDAVVMQLTRTLET